MKKQRWVLFWQAETGFPELYIALASGGEYFETGRIELAHSFEFARDAYDWAAKRARLADWKVGLR
jgi:hypothetical protein